MCEISLRGGGHVHLEISIRYESQYANTLEEENRFAILRTKVQPFFSTGFVLEEFIGAGIG